MKRKVIITAICTVLFIGMILGNNLLWSCLENNDLRLIMVVLTSFFIGWVTVPLWFFLNNRYG